MSRSQIEIRGDKLWGRFAINTPYRREEDDQRLDEMEDELFRAFRAMFLFRGQQYISGGLLFIYCVVAFFLWTFIGWLVGLFDAVGNMLALTTFMGVAFFSSMLLIGLSWHTGRCFDIYFRHTIPSLISKWEDDGGYTYSHSGLVYEEGTALVPYSSTTYTSTHRIVTSGTAIVVNKQRYYKEITLTRVFE